MNIAYQFLSFIYVVSILLPISAHAEEATPTRSEFEKTGEAKFDAGDYSGSVKDYTKAIKADSKNSYLYYYRGLSKIFLKDHKGATDDASKAIELDEKNTAAFYLRGLAKKESGKNKDAIKDFTEGLKLSPGDYSMQLNLYSARAGAKNGLKDYHGAISDYDEAIKLKSDKAISYFLRGAAKLQIGEKEAALKDLSKAGDLGFTDAYDLIKKIRESKL